MSRRRTVTLTASFQAFVEALRQGSTAVESFPVDGLEGDTRHLAESLNHLAASLRRQALESAETTRLARESSDLFLTLIDSLDLGILVVDRETHEVLFCNERACDLMDRDFPACTDCSTQGDLTRSVLEYTADTECPHTWDLTCQRNAVFYRVESRPLLWGSRQAYTHVIDDVTRQTTQTSRLIQHVYHDDMTGLHNRRYCMEKMRELLASSTSFTLCYLDVDNLKPVNDRFDHVEGDAYLRLVCDIIKRSIREEDIFSRIGGDEFCIIFRNAPASIVEEKFQSISKSIRAMSYVSKPYEMSISYGVMEIPDDNTLGMEELLRQVDKRMYQHKRANKAGGEGETKETLGMLGDSVPQTPCLRDSIP